MLKENDANRLVFLGDLFDLWLYPVDTVPDTIPQIINNYPDIAAAIKYCVKNIADVFYIPGNHDMFVCQNDLIALGSDSKELQLIDAKTYNEKYSCNQFYIEHGNSADMFNAPDTSTV